MAFWCWRKTMKLLKASALALLVATPALAGGMAEPVMEPAVIEEDTTTSSRAGIIVPIIALILIGLAISNGGNDTPPVQTPG
jgi:hypothetical protein